MHTLNAIIKTTLIICFFIYQNAYCQKIKLLKEEKSSITLEFTFDTANLKKLINTEKIIDFSNTYHCVNQLNKPILPLFNFTFQLSDSTLSYSIQHSEKSNFKINKIRIGEKSKKRGITTSNINELPFNLIDLDVPYVYRNFIGQNLQIAPIQFDSLKNELLCFHKIEIKIQFEKKINLTPLTLDEPNLNHLNKDFFYSFKKSTTKLKSINPLNKELLIVYKDSNEANAKLLAHWKNQKGIKTNLLKIDNNSSIEIKNKIANYFSITPNLKYVLILGNQFEIPAHSYGVIDGDNYYSDSYFGQITDDFYPELFVGRITGSTNEIKSIINKSIFYEKDNFEGQWMSKSIGIGSNEGLGEGDKGEADWQHLQNIKTKLKDFGYTKIYEFYDGNHGGDDLPGSPDKIDIINTLNEGVSILNYTGHGDDNLMLTGQLSSSDIMNLNNKNKNPFVISVACDNGKFIHGEGSLAEAFLKCKDDQNFTGSIAFCGSSILMDWAPPMLTQDEIINSITSSDTENTVYSIGELFYESQIKMLNKYNSLGNGVMQTWILFGDPSVDLKTKTPQDLDISYEYNSQTNELNVNSKTDKVLLGISKNDQYLSSMLLKLGLNKITIETSNKYALLTFTKPNFKTVQFDLNLSKKDTIETSNEIIIFPNPISSENTYFKIKGLNSYNSILLVDVLGKTYDVNIQNDQNDIKIEIQDLSSGIYFLKINDLNNQVITKRIIYK